MGFFSRWLDAKLLQEARLGGVAYLANRKISDSMLGDYLPLSEARRTLTVLYRLGHLIYRMETCPCKWTCIASKWYVDNVQTVQLSPDAKPFVDRLANQLRHAITEYEIRSQTTWDAVHFAKLLTHVRNGANFVLYGPCGYDYSGAWIRPFPKSRHPRG